MLSGALEVDPHTWRVLKTEKQKALLSRKMTINKSRPALAISSQEYGACHMRSPSKALLIKDLPQNLELPQRNQKPSPVPSPTTVDYTASFLTLFITPVPMFSFAIQESFCNCLKACAQEAQNQLILHKIVNTGTIPYFLSSQRKQAPWDVSH